VSCAFDTKDNKTAQGNDSSNDSQNCDDIKDDEKVGADVGPGANLLWTKTIFHSADIA